MLVVYFCVNIFNVLNYISYLNLYSSISYKMRDKMRHNNPLELDMIHLKHYISVCEKAILGIVLYVIGYLLVSIEFKVLCFHRFDNRCNSCFDFKYFCVKYRCCSFWIGIVFLLLTRRLQNIIWPEDLAIIVWFNDCQINI